MTRLVAARGERTATVFGYRIRLDLSEHIQRGIYLGAYENDELTKVRRLLEPGMTFVDVGANVGVFSLLAASVVGPRGRVIAVEPSPYAAARLEETVAANELDLEVVCAALGDAQGVLPLCVPPDASGNHTPTMTARGEGSSR